MQACILPIETNSLKKRVKTKKNERKQNLLKEKRI